MVSSEKDNQTNTYYNVIYKSVLCFSMLWGVIVRIIQYSFNRSLWLDEAALASSIVTRSYGGLLGGLDYNQIAPIGFLFAEKFFILLFGNNEFALRVFPLLCGVVSIFLFFFFC